MTTLIKTRKPFRDIVVIGASTGEVATLTELVKSLPTDFLAPIFVVMHVPADSPSLLLQLHNSVSVPDLGSDIGAHRRHAGNGAIDVAQGLVHAVQVSGIAAAVAVNERGQLVGYIRHANGHYAVEQLFKALVGCFGQ